MLSTSFNDFTDNSAVLENDVPSAVTFAFTIKLPFTSGVKVMLSPFSASIYVEVSAVWPSNSTSYVTFAYSGAILTATSTAVPSTTSALLNPNATVGLTKTLTENVTKYPSFVVAVITAFPLLTGVTIPFTTVATFSLSDDHFTFSELTSGALKPPS